MPRGRKTSTKAAEVASAVLQVKSTVKKSKAAVVSALSQQGPRIGK